MPLCLRPTFLASTTLLAAALTAFPAAAGHELPTDAVARTETPRAKQPPVSAVALSADGARLVTLSQNGAVRVWEVATGKALWQHEGNSSIPASLPAGPACEPDALTLPRCSFTADGGAVAVGLMGKSMLFDAATGKVKRTEEEPSAQGTGIRRRQGLRNDFPTIWQTETAQIQIFSSGEFSNHSRIVVRDRKTGKERQQEVNSNYFLLSPDGRRLASVDTDMTNDMMNHMDTPYRSAPIRIWDLSDGQLLHTVALEGKAPTDLPINEVLRRRFASRGGPAFHCLAFSPNGELLAWHDGSDQVRLFSLKTRGEAGPLPRRAGDVCYAFSPDGRTLAAAGADKIVRLWEIATGEIRREFAGHTGPVTGLSFSADSRLLASGSADGTALIWDVRGAAAPRSTDQPRTIADADAVWAALQKEAGPAETAVRRLLADPTAATPWLRDRLASFEAGEQETRIGELLRDLESPEFAVREKATNALRELRGTAKHALRKLLDAKPSLETYKRAEELLVELRVVKAAPPAEVLGVLRALEALERIGNADAQAALAALAKEAAYPAVKVEAAACLQRLAPQR